MKRLIIIFTAVLMIGLILAVFAGGWQAVAALVGGLLWVGGLMLPKVTQRPPDGGARRSSGGVSPSAPSKPSAESDRPRRARRSGARR